MGGAAEAGRAAATRAARALHTLSQRHNHPSPPPPTPDSNGGLLPDDRNAVPPAVLSALFFAVLLRSLYREAKQFVYSIPDGDGTLLQRVLSSEQFQDFWNWLDLLHITLGISTVALVWAQSANALPVLAMTSFLRWWGTLFYLQVKRILCAGALQPANFTFDAFAGV